MMGKIVLKLSPAHTAKVHNDVTLRKSISKS